MNYRIVYQTSRFVRAVAVVTCLGCIALAAAGVWTLSRIAPSSGINEPERVGEHMAVVGGGLAICALATAMVAHYVMLGSGVLAAYQEKRAAGRPK